MGRPITQEDIDVIAETFKDMEHLSIETKNTCFFTRCNYHIMGIISILLCYNSFGSLDPISIRHIPLKQGG